MSEDTGMSKSNGKVFLVGAGPGDPELLTIKARRLLEEADVTDDDRLISDDVLELVPVGVPKVFVGKAPGNYPAPQTASMAVSADDRYSASGTWTAPWSSATRTLWKRSRDCR